MRERETDIQRERDRYTDRERETDIQRERDRYTDRERETEKERDVLIMIYLNVLFCIAKAMASLATILR